MTLRTRPSRRSDRLLDSSLLCICVSSLHCMGCCLHEWLSPQVTHRCCHGLSSTSSQQEESESLHFSFSVSMEMQSDDWDTAVQVTQVQTPRWLCPSHYTNSCLTIVSQSKLHDRLTARRGDKPNDSTGEFHTSILWL